MHNLHTPPHHTPPRRKKATIKSINMAVSELQECARFSFTSLFPPPEATCLYSLAANFPLLSVRLAVPPPFTHRHIQLRAHSPSLRLHAPAKSVASHPERCSLVPSGQPMLTTPWYLCFPHTTSLGGSLRCYVFFFPAHDLTARRRPILFAHVRVVAACLSRSPLFPVTL
jgi:hypothetical protein